METGKTNFINRISAFFADYFSFNGMLVSQQQAEQNIREGVSFRGTNIVILILAILIASLGLNTNSPAVIIGAMLISPLMGPIIGIGLGVGIHDYDLIKRCLRNLIMAAGFSIIASTIFFLISPVNEQHSELLARTSPTIYDVLIGFVGGGAGIVALGSTNKGNVIPGVAIATALMPPLCTAGYGLATWQPNYFLGASYLFVINSIYIAFATFIGVKLMKYKGVASDSPRSRRIRRTVYILAVLTMLPSIYLTYNMLRENRFTRNADRFISAECNFPATQVINRNATIVHGQKELNITLIGRALPADSLKEALEEKLKYYGLAGTELHIIQGSEYYRPATQGNTTVNPTLYTMAQSTIQRQEATIDSLQNIIGMKLESSELMPEIEVLFPKIQEMALNEAVFAKSGSTGCDSVTVAIVKTHGTLGKEERIKLADYLQARLNTKQKVTVINL